MIVDKNGIPVKQFDLLKFYHFTGARRKKYYMYKWVLERDDRLYAHHLGDLVDHTKPWSGGFCLHHIDSSEFEIIQGFTDGDYEDRKL